MPYIDFDSEPNLAFAEAFDITIIGAGAAGILLAVKLTEGGKKVLLIESGHFKIGANKQKLNEAESTGKSLSHVWGRKRAIGGTTLAWGGQSLPFSASDFSHRPWVENSGWPVSYKTIAQYYNEANSFMGIDTLNYHEDIFSKAKITDPGIDSSLLDFHVSKWAPQPDFQLLHKNFLEKNVTVLYNAHLYRIDKSSTGAINEIVIKNFKQDAAILKIKVLIIAGGGIETVRILLNNNLGNHSQKLGKGFMEHPCIELGDVITENPYTLQKHFNTHLWNQRKYSVRLSLSERFQAKNKTLNCSASFMFRPPEDKFDPYAELVSFKKDLKFHRIFKVLKVGRSLSKSLWAYINDHFYYKINAANKLVLMVEQEPDNESYISLSDLTDEFGIPKAKIFWHITHKTWETVLKISDVLKKEVERLSLGQVKLYDHISAANKNWADHLSDVNHHMGGCRMSSVKEEGVVDINLQVWGAPNIYVCSCAVFPTSSHSNPTLTMLALGIRLSEYLLKKCISS